MKPFESEIKPSESLVTPSKLPPNPTNPEKSQKKRSNAANSDPEKSVNNHAGPLPNFTQIIVLAMINKADGQCFSSDICKLKIKCLRYCSNFGNQNSLMLC